MVFIDSEWCFLNDLYSRFHLIISSFSCEWRDALRYWRWSWILCDWNRAEAGRHGIWSMLLQVALALLFDGRTHREKIALTAKDCNGDAKSAIVWILCEKICLCVRFAIDFEQINFVPLLLFPYFLFHCFPSRFRLSFILSWSPVHNLMK